MGGSILELVNLPIPGRGGLLAWLPWRPPGDSGMFGCVEPPLSFSGSVFVYHLSGCLCETVSELEEHSWHLPGVSLFVFHFSRLRILLSLHVYDRQAPLHHLCGLLSYYQTHLLWPVHSHLLNPLSQQNNGRSQVSQADPHLSICDTLVFECFMPSAWWTTLTAKLIFKKDLLALSLEGNIHTVLWALNSDFCDLL